MNRRQAKPATRWVSQRASLAARQTNRNRASGQSDGRGRPSGFTLVEVLVALAIVAVALAAGTRASQALIGSSERLSEVTTAQWCAENLLANLSMARRYPDLGEQRNDCLVAGRKQQTLLRVSTTPNPNFRRVDVQVLNEAGQPLLSLATVLANQ